MSGFGFIYSFYMLLLTVEIWLVFRPHIVKQANEQKGVLRLVYKAMALGVTEITERGQKIDQKIVHALAVIGIPAACVLHGYVGFLFGAIKANPWWSSAIMPVVFLVSAIVSGIAMLIILYLVWGWWTKHTPRGDTLRSMMRYLWIFLISAVSLEMLELLNKAYESGEEWHIMSLLITDHLGFKFWGAQLLLGSLLPLILLRLAVRRGLPNRLMMALGGLSAALVLMQVFSMRWNVVIGGQLFSKSFRGFTEYHPTLMGREGLLMAMAVLAAPFVVLLIVTRLLPTLGKDAIEPGTPGGAAEAAEA
jgi:Ni/Fe-hydrogenase subunit HybB-like protein